MENNEINETIEELDENKIEVLDSKNESYNNDEKNDIELLNKKLKSSRTKNLVLTFFLVIFILIFSTIGVFSFFIFKTASPLFKGIFNKAINIASISQIVSSKRLDLQKFSEKLAFIDDCINLLYYYDKDNTKIEDAMFKGYMNALGDKYADYFPTKDFEEFTEKTTEGIYYGIGCVVTQDTKTKDCVVNAVYEDSPAEKGGMKVGDIFVSVDSENVRGNDLQDIVNKIKGPENTKREITVFRPLENSNVDIICYCGKVDIKLVSYKLLDDDIAYLDIDEFTGKAETQFKKAIDEIVEKDVKGLIIDLRTNPGGELYTICSMLDYILKDNDAKYTFNQKEEIFDTGKTLLAYIKEKDKIVDAAYATDKHKVDLPIVILTDYNTASAAELFTEALRDYNKAQVVGIRTYGKGVVQNIIPIDDGSAIKFTVSEYFPPSGYGIDKVGIIPDYSLDYGGFEVFYDDKNNIVTYDNDTKYVFGRDGSIIEEVKLNIATKSDLTISTRSELIASISETVNISLNVHEENLKIYDENNSFLDEDWYVELDDKYDDKQLLQAIVVLKDKLK